MNNARQKDASLKHRSSPRAAGLKLVAIFEGAKGFLVLAAGCGLLLLIHRDLHQLAAELIGFMHLNPANRYPRIFLDLADRIHDGNLWTMAGAAAAYAAARLAEAVGLWLERRWAEWFGFLSGAMYLPLEFYELLKGVSRPKLILFTLNLAIVLYLLNVLMRHRAAARHRKL